MNGSLWSFRASDNLVAVGGEQNLSGELYGVSTFHLLHSNHLQ